MSLGDLLDSSDKSDLFSNSLEEGDVFLKDFEDIDHPKFFIVAGISVNFVFLCSVFINSRIHPSIKNKQDLLELQIPLKKSKNPFLKYDSFANCSTPIPMKAKNLNQWIMSKSCKVIGAVDQGDLESIVQAIKNSGLLSEEEIQLYFS